MTSKTVQPLSRSRRFRQEDSHGLASFDCPLAKDSTALQGELRQAGRLPAGILHYDSLCTQGQTELISALRTRIQHLQQKEAHGLEVEGAVSEEVDAQLTQPIAKRDEVLMVEAHPGWRPGWLQLGSLERALNGCDQQIARARNRRANCPALETLDVGAEVLERSVDCVELSVVQQQNRGQRDVVGAHPSEIRPIAPSAVPLDNRAVWTEPEPVPTFAAGDARP